MDFSSNFAAIAIAGAFALIFLLKLWKRSKSRGNLVPEAPGGLPIIGHFHRLGEKKNLALILTEMADKYGSMFSLRFGVHTTVIISDHKAIKECFTINDKFIAYRPPSTQAQIVGYSGSSFGFAPYGPYWRNLRKLASIELLSSQRTKMLNYVQKSEVNYLVKDLYDHCNSSNAKIDISECIQHMVFNMITRMVAGKRFYVGNKEVENVNGRPMSEVIKDFMNVAGALVPGDFIPLIGWLDITGVVKNMKSISNEVGVIVDKWIEEHKMKKAEHEDKKDFLDVMLSVIQDEPSMGLDQATIIKGTSTAIILAGSDTTAITAIWVLSNLLNNKKALQKCQEELDLKVGRDRCVEVDDLAKLEYLSACIKETLRLFPPGPLGIPRHVAEDCYISGYFIPKGTRLFLNFYKLHRDPEVWRNPEEFIPERFLTDKSHIDVTGNNFEYLPFSGGRRHCPGTNLAMQVLNLSLARLLQAFNFKTPSDKPLDMSIGQAIVLPREYPLELVLTARLAPHLYDQECN
ncbi:cytochrome P450 CYP82J17-like [Euphorbia lathyris]|uniref:cytochrome P450 CYP82J17-like n=1 Tax=Euphorbia lathyris TaxID=212925 RepID=UPI0033131EDE